MRFLPVAFPFAVLLAACQASLPVAPSPTPTSAPPSAQAAMADPCTTMSPVPSGTSAITLDGWGPFVGLEDPAFSGMTDLPVTVRVASLPGAAEQTVHRFTVRYRLERPSGTTELPEKIRRFTYDVTIRAGGETKFGLPTGFPVQLPLEELKAQLAAGDRPTAVKAAVRFEDATGKELTDERGKPFEVELPLSLGKDPTPGLTSRLAACMVPTPSPRPDVDIEPNSPPKVADVVGTKTEGPLRFVDGKLSGGPLTATFVAPPGSAGAVVKGVQVTYTWRTKSNFEASAKPVTVPISPVVIAPGQDTAEGPAATFELPIDTSGLAAAVGAADEVQATFELMDEQGYLVLDKNFQNTHVVQTIALR